MTNRDVTAVDRRRCRHHTVALVRLLRSLATLVDQAPGWIGAECFTCNTAAAGAKP